MTYPLKVGFLLRRIGQGDAFVVSENGTIPKGKRGNIHIRNPKENEQSLWLAAMNVSSQHRARVTFVDAFESTTDGKPITVQNAEMDVPSLPTDDGDFEAYKNSAYIEKADSRIPLGIVQGDSRVAFYPMLVRPGREFVIEAENMANKDSTTLISLLLCRQ